MKPETAKHFNPAKYARYPHAENFVVREPDGELRTVTLWHNSSIGDNSEAQPRFFEEDHRKLVQVSSTWLPSAVPSTNRMTRDNYNNVLHELAIPIAAHPGEYAQEEEIYVWENSHRVIIEQTGDVEEAAQRHRRIRRQRMSSSLRSSDSFDRVLPIEQNIISRKRFEEIRKSQPPLVAPEESKVDNYRQLIKKLEGKGVIFAEDFGHWLPQPASGAKHELRTRINAPRK